MKWRVEALFRTKMGQEQWVRFDGPFETRAEAEIAMKGARCPHKLRVVQS
jgi:hypothetical protein